MINIFKGFIRLVIFFTLSVITVVLVAVGNIIARLLNANWAVIGKNNIICSWAQLTALLLNMKVKIEGHPPKSPFILVSNHLSYMDVVPLWIAVDGTFIAKSEIKSWPFFGWATNILGIIFIDRELKRDVHRVNNIIKSTITEHQGIIIFPEGTSTQGETVYPFHPALLQYPAEFERPVHYASITYKSFDSDKLASKYICWWGDMSFFDHFWELLKLSGFEVSIKFGNPPIVNPDRKQLAQQLHQVVKTNFEPVKQEDPQEMATDI